MMLIFMLLRLISKLSLKPDSVPNYTYKDGLFRYKSRIWIGLDPNLRSELIQALYNSAIRCHSGAPVTYRRLKKIFAWRGMKK
jgi:hypothetical protein